MARVVVVGGGVAGVAAALAAARRGADTTLVEASPRVGVSRASMPLILSDGWGEEDLVLPLAASLSKAGVDVRTGEVVTSVQHKEGEVLVSQSPPSQGARRGRNLRFDSLVICTGAAGQVPQLRGLSKPNVFVMRGPGDYLALSRGLGGLTTFAVTGPVPLALKLGEILSAKGKRVLLYCGKTGLVNQFSLPVADAIRREASEQEGGRTALIDDSFDSVLGVGRAEAVASGGVVRTCDGVVVIPRSVPLPPAVDCDKGNDGGLLVDASMSTSLPGVLAAGDCAEIRFKSGSVPARLFSTSRMGGEVAGINAAGGRAAASPSWVFEQTYFGLEFCSAGLTEAEALAMGLDAATGSGECADPGRGGRGRQTLVSLVYDRETHQVYGLQVAGWRASSLSNAASMVISLGLTLEQLVHIESPYSPGSSPEVSPIALTAGKIAAVEGG